MNKMKSCTLKALFLALTLLLVCLPLFCETLPMPPANYHHPDAGSEHNPFLIESLANLRWLSESPYYWGGYSSSCVIEAVFYSFYFLQIADIDASETIGWYGGQGFSPIGWGTLLLVGGMETDFFGHYDGNGFEISNLHIMGTPMDWDFVFGVPFPALFGSTVGATIENVRLTDLSMVTSSYTIVSHYFYKPVGGLVGHALHTTVYNCSVQGSIAIICEDFDDYFDDYIVATIGGVVGELHQSQMIKTSSSVNITVSQSASQSGLSSVGGLVGRATLSEIENSYYFGDIAVNSLHEVRSGGLVGYADQTDISNCYVASHSTFGHVAGLVGWLGGTSSVSSSFWDTETTGVDEAFHHVFASPSITGVYGLPSAQMCDIDTYIDAGWDFESVWAIETTINSGYPYLQPAETIYILPPPSDLNASVDISSVVLSWIPQPLVNNGDIVSYQIYRNAVCIATISSDYDSFTNSELPDGVYKYYIVALYDINGVTHRSLPSNLATVAVNTTSIHEDEPRLHLKTQLLANYPNPFNPTTSIHFSLSFVDGRDEGNVVMAVYNIRGQHVRTLIDGVYHTGNHSVVWDGKDDMGRYVSSGIYFYRMTTESYSSTQKMILMK
jgi:hypothetical protein